MGGVSVGNRERLQGSLTLNDSGEHANGGPGESSVDADGVRRGQDGLAAASRAGETR
jgi:hypothetical protein